MTRFYDDSEAYAPTPMGARSLNLVRTRSTQLLEAQLAQIQRELERRAAMPADDYDVGTVLVFDKNFGGKTTYNYAAIKAGNDRWYLTGRNQEGMRWERLLEFITDKETAPVSVWRATSVDKDFDL